MRPYHTGGPITSSWLHLLDRIGQRLELRLWERQRSASGFAPHGIGLNSVERRWRCRRFGARDKRSSAKGQWWWMWMTGRGMLRGRPGHGEADGRAVEGGVQKYYVSMQVV